MPWLMARSRAIAIAIVALVLALAAGFACAHLLPEGLGSYTGSIVLTSAMLAIGCIASGLGAWCVLGYAIGDLFLPGHHAYFENWWTWLAAVLVSYAVLWLLVVGVPTTARAIAGSLFKKAAVARAIVAAVCGAALAYLWSQAAAVLIRPLWTFAGNPPTTEARTDPRARLPLSSQRSRCRLRHHPRSLAAKSGDAVFEALARA